MVGAYLYPDDHRERVAKGIAERKERGLSCGRPPLGKCPVLLRNLYDWGLSYNELGYWFNISKTSAYNFVNNNLEVSMENTLESYIVRRYVVDFISMGRISRECGISEPKVSRILKAAGVRKRKLTEYSKQNYRREMPRTRHHEKGDR